MRVMVTGHRPPKIGGYQTPNPTEHWIRVNLRAFLVKLQGKHPDLEGVCGMALGTDQIFAELCVELSIPFTAVLPFKGQEARWPEESRLHYQVLLDQAAKVVVVDEIPSYHSDTFGGKMALRNKWMIEHSDLAFAVWDGSTGGTANTYKQLWSKGRKIMLLDPRARSLTVRRPPPPEDEGPDVFDMFG